MARFEAGNVPDFVPFGVWRRAEAKAEKNVPAGPTHERLCCYVDVRP